MLHFMHDESSEILHAVWDVGGLHYIYIKFCLHVNYILKETSYMATVWHVGMQ